MKKVIIITLSLSFFLNSCSDFLDIPSETSLTTEVFYKTEADFQKSVNGIYAPLRNLYADGGANAAWAMGEMRSDNTYYMYNPDDRGLVDPEDIANFSSQPANAVSTAKYVTNYRMIARANQVLVLIDGMNFSEEAKIKFKGEASFLRALCYFDLVQYFGKLPLHLVPVKTREEAVLPLSEVDVVYNQIIKDATEAANLLPLKSKQEQGRATSGAANTLLGNIYMSLKKYSEAEPYFKKVIDSNEYELLPDYASVFSVTNKNNKESIFEIQYKEGNDGYANGFIYDFLPKPMPKAQVFEITGAANVQALGGQSFNIPTPELIAAYEPNDKRKNISIASITMNGITYPYIKKLLQPHAQHGNTGTNWPVYRYSEVLLSYAEALEKDGKGGQAIPYLNQVRTRAGLANSTNPNLADAIFDERRVELAFENKRWLDLVRTGKAKITMAAFGARVKANPQAYYFPNGIAPPPASFTTIDILFPLPASESMLTPFF